MIRKEELNLNGACLVKTHAVNDHVMIRKGELHLTESVCPRDFLGELEYWGLSALHLGHLR